MTELAELAHFFDLTSDLMCILNESGRCRQVNLAFERVLGYSGAELLDRPLADLAYPADRAANQTEIDRLLAGDSATSFTNRYSCKDGSWRWLDWTISAIDGAAGVAKGEIDFEERARTNRLLYCVARDVTEQLQMAQQMQRNSDKEVTARNQEAAVRQDQAAQLKIIFDQAAVGMARLSPEGRWIQVNQRLCDMLGYSMPELLQKTFVEITHPDDAAADQVIYEQLVSGDRPQATLEKRYLHKQGHPVWTHVSASTVRNAQGTLLYFIATIQDITEQKQATLALQSQKNDLLMVNRLLTGTMSTLKRRNQELDQFAYVTSHDLKAPLRAIANLATWLEEDLGDRLPAENKEQFDLLKNRVHRMEGLINGLLEYSRIGRTHQSNELVDVGSLLADIIDSLSPLGEFTIEIISPMPTLRAKRTPLTQVFSNLISNAIKHHDRTDGKVQIEASDQGDFYEFAIVDDGPGIEPAYHDKVFVIFQTLKSRDDLESTGIGLSLVEKTVSAEGGKITLESALGEGATFRFTWPKAPHRAD